MVRGLSGKKKLIAVLLSELKISQAENGYLNIWKDLYL